MDDVVAWEYRHEPLKIGAGVLGRVRSDLTDLGRNGWELISILELPEPDDPGVFGTTIAIMVLRRPTDRPYEFHYEPVKAEKNVGARFTFGSRDGLGRDGWELMRVERFPQPDRKGLFDQTVGIQVFRRPRQHQT